MLLTIYLGISLVCFGLFIFTKLYAVTLLVFGIRYGGKKTLKVLEDGQNNLYNEANDKTKEATDKIEKTLNTIFDKLGWFAFLISCFIPILQIILIFSLITSLLNKGNYERITKEDAEIQKEIENAKYRCEIFTPWGESTHYNNDKNEFLKITRKQLDEIEKIDEVKFTKNTKIVVDIVNSIKDIIGTNFIAEMSGDSTKIEIHAFDYGEYEINVENQDEIDALYEDLKIKHKIA